MAYCSVWDFWLLYVIQSLFYHSQLITSYNTGYSGWLGSVEPSSCCVSSVCRSGESFSWVDLVSVWKSTFMVKENKHTHSAHVYCIIPSWILHTEPLDKYRSRSHSLKLLHLLSPEIQIFNNGFSLTQISFSRVIYQVLGWPWYHPAGCDLYLDHHVYFFGPTERWDKSKKRICYKWA